MRTSLLLLSLASLARAVFTAAVHASAVAGSDAWLVLRELHAESALVGQGLALVAAATAAPERGRGRLLAAVLPWWVVAAVLALVPGWSLDAPLLRVADGLSQVALVHAVVATRSARERFAAVGVALLLFGAWALWLVTGSLVASVSGALGFLLLAALAWRAR